MAATFEVSIERREVLYCDGNGQAHVLSSSLWSPSTLGYVDRKVLAAQLRAIADVVDGEAS